MAAPVAAAAAAAVIDPVAEETAPVLPPNHSHKQLIDPWNVQGEVGADGVIQAINYLTLVEEFGTKLLKADGILERFERVTGHKPHRFMRRGIVFSHRDLDLILDKYERGEPFFLYTGRGPSSDSLHVGHTIPFEFTRYAHYIIRMIWIETLKLIAIRWLQEVFSAPLVIMLTDDGE